MTDRTPAAPHSSTIRTATRAGTTITARSTPRGNSLTEARHGRPHTSSYFGLTGYSSPSKPT